MNQRYLSCFFIHIWHFRRDHLEILPLDFNIQGKLYAVQEADIDHIQYISNEAKFNFRHAIFQLKTGDTFIITDQTKGSWIIQEYFKKTPLLHKKKFFPYIK